MTNEESRLNTAISQSIEPIDVNACEMSMGWHSLLECWWNAKVECEANPCEWRPVDWLAGENCMRLLDAMPGAELRHHIEDGKFTCSIPGICGATAKSRQLSIRNAFALWKGIPL